MKLRLENAKNASITCEVDGRFLHSKYNPENEAKIFVDSIECNFKPSCIIFLGASLPYSIPSLKDRFPLIPLYAIQYDEFFLNVQHNDEIAQSFDFWNHSFLSTKETNVQNLSETIFTFLGEEVLFSALIISWKASETVYEVESSIAWESMRIVLQKARDVLATRSFFSLRWLKNSLSFCKYAKNIVTIQKQNMPIFLVASGPSLQGTIKYIKVNQSRAIILCLSSSLQTLIQNDIIPDICIATDGGYYARKHLEALIPLYKKGKEIALAISTESNVPPSVLELAPIIPLKYGDGLDTLLLNLFDISSMHAVRNGTVSGTAAMFALSLTSQNVYAFGLDLSEGKGYNHAHFNAHETINATQDFRLNPLSKRLCNGLALKNAQGISPMEIYKQWFETRDKSFAARFIRVKNDTYTFNNTLGYIKDISVSTLDISSSKTVQKKLFKIIKENFLDSKKLIKIKNFIDSQRKEPSKEWIEMCALAESLAVKKYPDNEDYQERLYNKLQESFDLSEKLYL